MFTNPKHKKSLKVASRGKVVLSRHERFRNRGHIYSEDTVINGLVKMMLRNCEMKRKIYPKSNNSNMLCTGSSSRFVNRKYSFINRQPHEFPPPDLLKQHSSLFNEPQEFHPCTLKTESSSRIRYLDCYNPPHTFRNAAQLENLEIYRPQLKDCKACNVSASAQTPHKKIKSVIEVAPRLSQKSSEDLEYLKFSSAIVDEILDNDIYDDGELEKLFMTHLQQPSSSISQNFRWRAIREIANQLGLSPTLINKLPFHSTTTQNSPFVQRKRNANEKTTGLEFSPGDPDCVTYKASSKSPSGFSNSDKPAFGKSPSFKAATSPSPPPSAHSLRQNASVYSRTSRLASDDSSSDNSVVSADLKRTVYVCEGYLKRRGLLRKQEDDEGEVNGSYADDFEATGDEADDGCTKRDEYAKVSNEEVCYDESSEDDDEVEDTYGEDDEDEEE